MYILWETLDYDSLGRLRKYECFKLPNGYIRRASSANKSCMFGVKLWLPQQHSSHRDTVMDAKTLLPLSLFLSLPKGSTENVTIILGSNTPECSPVWRGVTGHLEIFISSHSVLLQYHCCSQHRGPILMRHWGHLAHKNCNEDKEQQHVCQPRHLWAHPIH